MLELRPLQKRAVVQINGALQRHRSCICCAPCGFGKRYIGVWYAMKIAEKGRHVLVATDRRILVQQFKDECIANRIRCGMIMGNEPEDRSAQIQVASIATLKRREWKDLPKADWCIIDESHKEDAAYSTLMALYPTAKFLGLTATPVGAEGKAISPVPWETVIEPVKNSELIQQGWLLPTQVLTPSEPDLKGVTIQSRKEYNQEELGRRVEECTIFADVFKWYEKFKTMPAIVFAPRVIYARGLAEQFNQRGIRAEVIEAGTSKRERRDCFSRFEFGECDVLVSVDVLREGFDAPHAQMGIDLQPNNQLRTYWQKCGRVKRPHEGQKFAVWLDFAGNFWRHLHPDEDPPWEQVTTTKAIADIVKRKKEKKENREPWSCPACSYVLAPWQRMVDGVCPNCGAKRKRPIRRIRMADGSLRSISAKESAKIKRNKFSQEQSLWFKYVKIAHYTGKTLNQAAGMYRQATGRWPDEGFIWYPERESDLCRRPAEVFPNVAGRR